MYFEAGQCVDVTGFLVKPVLRSGVLTAIAWRWNQVAMGCGQGGSGVQEPSHRSQAGVAVQEGLRSERAVLLPLDVQCLAVGDQDGYAGGALQKHTRRFSCRRVRSGSAGQKKALQSLVRV